MRPIPQKLRSDLSADPYYKSCCLCGSTLEIEWHHNLILAGRQSNEKETILPLCKFHHEAARKTEIKEVLDLIMLLRMEDTQIRKISKAVDYFRRKEYLKEKYSRN